MPTLSPTLSDPPPATRAWPDLRAVWRWHFYASLFCIPFVLWLSITGSLYLFRPQIEAYIDRPYENLALTGQRASADAIATKAIAAVPGAHFAAYELPQTPQRAVRVMVMRGADQFRVYVNPNSLAVMKIINEDDRFMHRVSHLHGELMLGDRGSMIVELAACWAIVMIVTGLILWWPRQARGLRGVLYPRLGRTFWRDLHAVVGIWVSALALFLLLTGLPWTKNWGGYLKEVRAITHTTDGPQDWTTGRNSEVAQRVAEDGHNHQPMNMHGPMPPLELSRLDAMIAHVAPLHLARPVLISPPKDGHGPWRARSDAADRPLRTNLTLDANTGAVLSERPFSARHPIDQIIGVGTAAHEGQLFGWPNQLLGVLAALGLVTLSSSGIVLWLKRRKTALFAPPVMLAKPRFSWRFAAGFGLVTVLLPTFGLSAVGVLLFERLVLRHIAPTRKLFGLA